MTALRVYISGPMTGRPNLNRPAFYAAAALLAEAGHIPVNPAEVCAQLGATEWTDCMRADIRALCECDAIALLPGWEMSQGRTKTRRPSSRATGIHACRASENDSVMQGPNDEFVGCEAVGEDNVCRLHERQVGSCSYPPK